MGRFLGIAAFVLIASGGAYLVGVRQGKNVRLETTTDEFIEAQFRSVTAQGTLQPSSGIINIIAIPGDEITDMLVAAGDPVKPDQPLIRFKSHEIRLLERDLASARLEEAKKRIEIEQQVANSKLKGAELSAAEAALKQQDLVRQDAGLALLRKQADQAQRSLDRLDSLAKDPVTKNVVSGSVLEKQALLVEKLQSDVEHAEGALESAKKGFELAVEAADSQLKAAQLSADSVTKVSPLSALQAAVDLAELNLQSTEIKAPRLSTSENATSNIKVLRVLAQKGERVGNMPLMQLGDVDRMECVAEVYEANLPRIKKGQTAILNSGAFKEPLRGVVTEVGQVIGRPSLPNPNPLSRQDIRTAEVIIELDQASSQHAASYINLQVEVEFDIEESAEVEAPTDDAPSDSP